MGDEIFLWPEQESVPQLGIGQVHVWAWDLDRQPTPAEWALLDAHQLQRARRFSHPTDRDRFVRAHAGMRQLLASYMQFPPAQISYMPGPYGKPAISWPEDAHLPIPLSFNLTHSGSLAVLAVSADHEVGIDIEAMRPTDAKLASRFFSPAEMQTLQALPQEIWLRGFYRCWTAKEALLKGAGRGLHRLQSFYVEVDPRREPALLAVHPDAPLRNDWRLLDLQPAPDFVGILAVRNGENADVRYFTWNAPP